MQVKYVIAKMPKIKSFSENTPEKNGKRVAISHLRIKL